MLTSTGQKLAQLTYTTHGLIPDGMLVRVSTIDNDADHAFAVQAEFIANLTRSLIPGLRQRVFEDLGTAAFEGRL